MVLGGLDIQSGLGLGLLWHILSCVIVILIHLRRLRLVDREPHKVNLNLGLILLLLIRVSLIMLLRIIIPKCCVHHVNCHLIWLHYTSRGLLLLQRLLVLRKSLHYLSGWVAKVHIRWCSGELLRAVAISLSCCMLDRILIIRLLYLLIFEPVSWAYNWWINLQFLIWRIWCCPICFIFGCFTVTHQPIIFITICLLLVNGLTHWVIKLIIELIVLDLKILQLLINHIRINAISHVLLLLLMIKLTLNGYLLLIIL